MCGLGDMKWFITLTLVCVARIAEGVALRCSPGQDACATEQQHIELLRPAQVARSPALDGAEVGCLAGTEWESQCHRCHCSPAGRAECTRLPNCQGSSIEPLQCKPNTTFHRDCNTCLCLDSGLVLCTIESCSSRVPVHKKSELVSGRECAPGSFWRSQCNSCHCSAEGYALCTEIGCIGQAHERELRCAPNTMWKNECNTCSCTADGRALCTKMGCGIFPNYSEIVKPARNDVINKPADALEHIDGIDIIKPQNTNELDEYDTNRQKDTNLQQHDDRNFELESHKIQKRAVCKANQLFQSDCNSCKCAADGQSYTCTQNECMDKDLNKEVEVFMENEGVDHIERHSVCKPRGTFYIGCNTCHCNYDGTDYTCTNKPCPLPDDVELFHELREMKPIVPYTRLDKTSDRNVH